jgi:hypothetical protein
MTPVDGIFQGAIQKLTTVQLREVTGSTHRPSTRHTVASSTLHACDILNHPVRPADDMGKDIALPEVTQHAIMNYPLPDHQTGQKYSPFTYLHTDATRNLCGTVHNVASPEMLYCSSSSGEHFDRRARELRQSPSVVEGIITHANRDSAKTVTISNL